MSKKTVEEMRRELAELLVKERQKASIKVVSIPRFDRVNPIPASYAQERLWFLQQLSEESSALYLMPSALQLEGRLDRDCLIRSFKRIVDRHETLRTFLLEKEGEAFQSIEAIDPEASLAFESIDLRGFPDSERICQEMIAAHALAPFAANARSLFRISLLRMRDDRHILLINIHHSMSDGWSMNILIRELATLYTEFLGGRPDPLPSLVLQYADYSAWQRGDSQAEALSKQMKFWKKELEGLPPLLTLPIDRPRPYVQSFAGANQAFHLDSKVVEKLRELSRIRGTTLYMTCGAALALLLSRYSRQNDIAFGTPVAGRPKRELEDIIGFFTNTLVIRTRVNEAESFSDFLEHFKQKCLNAFANQDLPFEQLVAAVNPERSLSHSPLFQVMYSLDSTKSKPLELPNLQLTKLENPAPFAKFELTLTLLQSDDAIDGLFEYNSDLFEAGTISRMIKHFKQILHNLSSDTLKPLKDLPMMDAAECKDIIARSNFQGSCAHSYSSVPRLIERQVERKPNAVALVSGGEHLSYNELNERANRLAFYLHTQGVGPEVCVGLSLERSFNLIIGLLAIMKVGGAYVPIDPALPLDRVSFMLKDADVRCILTQESLVSRFETAHKSVYCLDRDQDLWAGQSIANLNILPSPKSLAYMIYTSGTTGRAKGVMIEHVSIDAYVQAARDSYDFTAEDRVLQFAPMSFDISADEIFTPLIAGSSLFLRSDNLATSALQDYLVDNRITKAFLPTAFWQQFTSELTEYSLRLPKSFRLLVIGGSAAQLESVLAWQKIAHPDSKLINAYGPTEATIAASMFWIDSSWITARGQVPIGTSLAHTQLYVLDSERRLVPPGVMGELYIGGIQVARGYRNRPELDDLSFLANPFNPESRLYRSGDLCRWLPDGNLEYLGRIDSQVKIRGFRIEPGEVENCIAQFPGVREALIVVDEAKPGQPRLVAYAAGHDLEAAALRSHIKAILPEYMIPSAFVLMENFPLTNNGKIDRAALPTAKYQADEEGFVAARNAVEKILSQTVALVLGLAQVGVNDNFFQIGGDSILLLQVVSKARHQGIEISAKQMFEYQSIAELAPYAKHTRARQDQAALSGKVGMTAIQHYFFENPPPHFGHFNQSALLKIHDHPQFEALNAACNSILRHHDALRARFLPLGKQWVQEIDPITDHDLPLLERIDLAHEPEATRGVRISERCSAAQKAIDITRGPLFKAILFEGLGDGDARLFLVIHHLLVDGYSWRIILDDLFNSYRQLKEVGTSVLPEKTSTVLDWAHGLEAFSASEVLQNEIPYWHGVLNAPHEIPLDFAYIPTLNTVGSVEHFTMEWSCEATQNLVQSVPAAYNTQINDILLSALAMALSKWTKRSDTRIDLEGHGRHDLHAGLDLSRTVGWFTSLYPLTLHTVGSSPAEVIKSIKEQLRGVPNQGIGYGVLRYVSEEKSLADTAYSSISFNYLGQFDQTLVSAGVSSADEDKGLPIDPAATRSQLLDLSASIINGQLSMTFAYSRELHKKASLLIFAAIYKACLDGLIEHCLLPDSGGQTLSDFPDAAIDAENLDSLIARYGRGEKFKTIYPLTPMQKGMLFHSLMDSGSYVENFSWIMRSLDARAFQAAWEQLIERHDILRTFFVWDEGESPRQLVRRRVASPWKILDWRQSNPTGDDFQSWLEEERKKGFAIDEAPLMRLTLIQIPDNAYRFVWTIHHSLIDGWSLGLLLEELFALYSQAEGKPSRELTEPRPFSDYLRWLSRQDFQAAKRFWTDHLKGINAPTPLMVDRRPAGGQSELGICHFEASEELNTSLRKRIKAHRLTMNTVIQAAWAILLARYSGTGDVLFGATVSGRPGNLTGVESIVGIFINTLPARFTLPADGFILPWLQTIQLQQAAREEFAFLSLPDIQKLSEISTPHALFESLVVFENYPSSDSVKEIAIGIEEFQAGIRTNYPLTLVVAMKGALTFDLSYHEDRFDRDTISRLATHFQNLLLGIVSERSPTLPDLDILDATERNLVLFGFNNTSTAYPKDITVHRLFEKQVASTPFACALRFGDQQLTFEAFNQSANRLSHYLIKQGVGPGSNVGICLERSFHMIIGMMAILKAGACYIPIEPYFPSDRIEFMQQDAAMSLILTQAEHSSLFASSKAPVLVLDEDQGRWGSQSDSNPETGVTARDLAYIIYTSGSTGRPKGAMNAHIAVINRLYWMQDQEHYRLTPRDRILHKTAFTFDVSVGEIFWPLCFGACLIIAKPEGQRDNIYLANMIESERITMIHFVPSQLQVFLEEKFDRDFRDLRQVHASGEALPYALSRRFFEQFPAVKLHNIYGPTECAEVTAKTCSVQGDQNPISIGVPFANTQIYILDGSRKPTPIGVPGELYIGGIQVGPGYMNRPDLTAARFIEDPFVPGNRLYQAGDLARWRPDGEIEYMGRLDFQVKIRGFRVEMGEIENSLLHHPDIQDSVVLAKQGPSGGQQLVAYVVPKAGRSMDFEAMKNFLKNLLPEYMLPSALVLMPSFPLNSNGKTDRKSLPEPEAVVRRANLIAPRNSIESGLVEIASGLLGGLDVGIGDDFFQIGGDSLLAMQFISRIRRTLAIELSLKELFDHAVLSDLAKLIAGKSSDTFLTIPVRSRSGELPASFAQERLRFIDKLAGKDQKASAVYLMALPIHLSGNLNTQALLRSLRALVQRHEILRSSLFEEQGRTLIEVHDDYQLLMPIIDLRALDPTSRKAALQQLIEDDAEKGFPDESPSLLRVSLVQLAVDDHALLMTMHHSISDGWSIGVMFQEIGCFYTAFAEDTFADLPSLPVQYADYAAWQRELPMADHSAYWIRQLNGLAPVLLLPWDQTRPPVPSFAGGYANFALAKELTLQLKSLAQRSNTTLFMVLGSAFACLLYRNSQQKDFAFGTSVANRDRPELEGLIGFFVNTIVLRVQIEGENSFRQFLESFKHTCLDAFAHQDLPFEQLVSDINPVRSLAYSPLFQTMFVLENNRQDHLELPGLTLDSYQSRSAASKFDLTLFMKEVDGRLQATFEYSSDLFHHATLERMSRQFENLLNGIVADPQCPIATLPLLSPEDRDQLLHIFNPPPIAYPKEVSVSELFECQARLVPDSLAVIGRDEQLSYRELNAEANRLARLLRARGVKPNSLVALHISRSPSLIVGLLAVLKSGAAFLPIDASYPDERVAYMLKDSEAVVLLSESKLVDDRSGLNIICLDRDRALWSGYEGHDLAVIHIPSDMAYIIYTSGSTGKPKGTMIPHSAFTNYVLQAKERYTLSPKDRVLQFVSISFDMACEDIYPALAAGAGLVLRDETDSLIPADFLNFLESKEISKICLPTAYWQQVVKDALETCLPFPANLRYAVIGGSAVTMESVRLWQKWAGDCCTLLNGYGPTETTMVATALEVKSDWKATGSLVPIGSPIRNCRIYVLDERLELAPIGVPGEIFIGGEQLALGYWNRPELNAEKFLPDPFTERSSMRMYRTGDLARWLPQGDLEYLGRIDQQVKIRGFRIELGEIESRLLQCRGVSEAFILADEGPDGEPRLVAYVVGAELDTFQLKQELKVFLPNFMIPASFIAMKKLPLTSNGKVDRKALPALGLLPTDGATQSVHSLEEWRLSLIFQSILGMREVSPQDNFFEIGGNSLLALRLASEIKKEFGVNLPIIAIFQNATLRSLTMHITKASQEGFLSDELVKIRDGAEGVLILVAALTGSIVSFEKLCKLLKGDEGIYGIEALRDPHERSLKELAEHFSNKIIELNDVSRIRILGLSSGGLLAFEIGCQLQRAGIDVEYVGLLDTWRLSEGFYARDESISWLVEIVRSFHPPFDLGPMASLPLPQQMRWLENACLQAQFDLKGMVPHDLEDLARRFQAKRYMARDYQPSPSALPLHQFHAQKVALAPGMTSVDEREWREYSLGSVITVEIDCSHEELVALPFVQRIADSLDQDLGSLIGKIA